MLLRCSSYRNIMTTRRDELSTIGVPLLLEPYSERDERLRISHGTDR